MIIINAVSGKLLPYPDEYRDWKDKNSKYVPLATERP